MVAIPQGFEHCIAEPEVHHVMHRTLAEEMVQTEDSPFFKSSKQNAVEFPGRTPIAAEGFFDNDTRPVAAARFPKLLDDHPEVGGRNSQIKNRVLSARERLTQSLVGRRVRIIALHVAQQRAELVERRGVESPMLFKTHPYSRPEFIHIFRRPGHADYRYVQVAVFNHCLERREDLLKGEIPRS